MQKVTSVSSTRLKLVLSWVFCFLFAVAGFSFISVDLLIGLCYLASAVVLMPPLKKIFRGKSKTLLLILFLGIIGVRVLWSVSFLFFPNSGQ